MKRVIFQRENKFVNSMQRTLNYCYRNLRNYRGNADKISKKGTTVSRLRKRRDRS